LFPRKKDAFDVSLQETKSALGEFVKEYVITSRDVYDPDSFMDAAKETVINLLENNRQTKVKPILKCIMERTEIKTREVIVKFSRNADFSVENLRFSPFLPCSLV